MTSEVENYVCICIGVVNGRNGFFFKKIIIIIIIPTGKSTRARSHLNFARDGNGNRSAAAAVVVGPVYRNLFFPSPRFFHARTFCFNACTVVSVVAAFPTILKNTFNEIVLKRYLCVFSWYNIKCMCQPLKTRFNYFRYTYIFRLTSAWRLKNGLIITRSGLIVPHYIYTAYLHLYGAGFAPSLSNLLRFSYIKSRVYRRVRQDCSAV